MKQDREKLDSVENTEKPESLAFDTVKIPPELVEKGLHHTAEGLSGMFGRNILLTNVRQTLIPIEEALDGIDDLEAPVAGIYLEGTGDMPSQFMLMIPLQMAYRIVDTLLMQPPGTTNELDDLGRSALAEVGNVATSLFLNEIADLTHTDTRPTPPSVVVDMLGAVLNVILLPAGLEMDKILLIDADFQCCATTLNIWFWLIPDISRTILSRKQEAAPYA